jgi:DNA-binding PadR family transcriptional regulator
MIMELMAHPAYIRVLHAAERRPMRFFHFEQELGLNPAQVDRALKFLTKNQLLAPRPVDTAFGPRLTIYQVTARGTAFLEAFSAFDVAVGRRRAALGPRAAGDVRECSQ